MKQKLLYLLGTVSFGFGLLLAVVAFILLVTGKVKVAGIFAAPSLGLLLAGSNLKTYSEELKAK